MNSLFAETQLLLQRSEHNETSGHDHSLAFRVRFTLAALKGDRTISELATHVDLHPNPIRQWKDQIQDGMTVT